MWFFCRPPANLRPKRNRQPLRIRRLPFINATSVKSNSASKNIWTSTRSSTRINSRSRVNTVRGDSNGRKTWSSISTGTWSECRSNVRNVRKDFRPRLDWTSTSRPSICRNNASTSARFVRRRSTRRNTWPSICAFTEAKCIRAPNATRNSSMRSFYVAI